MSRGKYSPTLYRGHYDGPYDKNCYGQEPTPWTKELADAGVEYDPKTMFDNYDAEGYDRYGYSAFDADGNYVGISHEGVDRNGISELEYMSMTDEEFSQY